MADTNLVMEERNESIVSLTNRRDSCLRTAHFLTPSVTSVDAAVKAPPPYSFTNTEIAWSNYSRPIRDKTVYVPPLVFEPGVSTTRYLKWWEEINCCGLNGPVGDGIYGKSSSSEDSKVQAIEDEDLVPSSSNGTEADLLGKCSSKSAEVILIESDSDEDYPPPPVFSPKRKRKTAEDLGDSGAKLLKYGRNANSVPRQVARHTSSSTPNGTKSGLHENDSFKGSKRIFVESSSSLKRVAEVSTRNSCGNKESRDGDVQGRICSSSVEDNGNFHQVISLPKTAESEVMKTLEKEGKQQWTEAGLRLEERISIIEKLCDLLKTGKFSCNKKINK